MNFESKHISRQELDTIERYLRNEMSDADRAKFEQRMANDPELRQAVTDYGMLIEGVKTAALKSRLDAYHTDIEGTISHSPADSHAIPQKSRPLVKYLIAASVLLVAGWGTWLIALQESPQEELFAAYFEPDPGLITPMSSTDRYQFYTGMIDYKRENYEEAISKWQPLLEDNLQSDTLNYFMGVAHLAQGEHNEALPYLQSSTQIDTSVFIDKAYFYLGLAYLKNDDREAAIQALKNSRYNRAAELLAEIEDHE